MIRKSLQFSQEKEVTADNSNSNKSQQLQQLNLEQLDVASGGYYSLRGGFVPEPKNISN